MKTLKAPDGGPRPPSLAAWLAFDAQGLQIMDERYVWISAPLRKLGRSLVEEECEVRQQPTGGLLVVASASEHMNKEALLGDHPVLLDAKSCIERELVTLLARPADRTD